MLAAPAPRREWFRTEEGKWASRPWTKQARAAYIAAGGWFQAGAHDFYTPPVASVERSLEGKKCNYRCQLHQGQGGYVGDNDE